MTARKISYMIHMRNKIMAQIEAGRVTVSAIAAKLRITRDCAGRHLREMESEGLVSRERVKSPGFCEDHWRIGGASSLIPPKAQPTPKVVRKAPPMFDPMAFLFGRAA